MRFPIRFNRWFVPLAVITGMSPSRSYVETSEETADVVMGSAFRARLPRAGIASAARGRVGLMAGIGVHGMRGTWVVNGSREGIVEIALREPVPARVLGIGVQLSRLFVSVEDPDALVADLTAGRPVAG